VFVLVVVAWLIGGAILAVYKIQLSRTDRVCLATLRRAATSIELGYLKVGESALQPAVERIRAEGLLVYCAIVSAEGRILAHSSSRQVGQAYREPAGERVRREEFTRVRFVERDGRSLLEYRAPLKVGQTVLGAVHMAAAEPLLWPIAGATIERIVLVVAGAMVMIALGAWVLYRTAEPLAGIEYQLCSVARASSAETVRLEPVPVRGGAALGWNRLASAHEHELGGASLVERLSQAVQRHQQKNSQAILDSLVDGIAVTDSDGRVTLANQALAAFVERGQASADVCGQHIQDYFANVRGTTSDPALFGDQPPERTAITELPYEDNGERRFYRVARHPLRGGDAAGSLGHVWTIRDVTQQKLAEQMRDQFLDAATHELRTPLANIKAYAETLSLSDMLDVEQQKAFCNTINTEATRLARFIDDLLSVSSMEVGSLSLDYQEVDLERLIHEATQKVQPLVDQKKIHFQTIRPAKLPRLKADKDKLTVVLVNLLGNAAKYTPEGGRISLTVRAGEEQLVIEIQDSGIGISEEELPRVFEKFFRSADPRVHEQAGSGLGLSFAEEVVRRHGGTIDVSSALNKGSTFSMVLPIS
jgi:two-component system phosphate regulon sensor histidine kinase PhoR